MKTSVVVLSFLLILAAHAAAGDLTKLSHRWSDLLSTQDHHYHINSHGQGFHRPTDCCISYASRNIRCVFMKDYSITTSGCSRPGVIFKTKRGQSVCADPSKEDVRKCMASLKLDSVI
ncbi:C-C motif chemokine 3 [Camelus ferus]|uniref:C-C motif chemokine n=2 Tax=Camelus TaxID=9836 RepID=A0A8B7K386_CAMFR|nr:C-C motif chemokine 3 [Camelus bactrianus]XP_014406238.1 C-C motif chemokine 3 [Camelus ferus]